MVGDFGGSGRPRRLLRAGGGRRCRRRPMTRPRASSSPRREAVEVGDVVRVRGTVAESFGRTQLGQRHRARGVPGRGGGHDDRGVAAGRRASADWEPLEGMAGHVPAGPHDLGVLRLRPLQRDRPQRDGRQMTPTAVFDPGSPEAADLAEANLLGRIVLDDGRNAENPDPALHPDGDVFTLDHRFRGGDTLAGVTGVLDFAFGDYRVQPTADAEYTEVNERPAAARSGRRQRRGRVVQRPELLHDAHGARRARRQHAGGVRAPAGEDHLRDHRDRRRRRRPDRDREQRGGARRTSSTGLNDGDGARALRRIETGVIGTDVIKVAFAYQPARVTPVGEHAILDSSGRPAVPRRLQPARARPDVPATTRRAASSPRSSTTSSRRAPTATPSATRTRATARGTAT